MRLTGRPSRRGSSIAAELTEGAFTGISDYRSAGPFGRRVAAADTRNPYDLVVRKDDRPAGSARPRNTHVTKEAFHTTCRPMRSRAHSVGRTPCTNRQAPVRGENGDPKVFGVKAPILVARVVGGPLVATLASGDWPEPPLAEPDRAIE